MTEKSEGRMRAYRNQLAASVAVAAFTFAATAWAEHGATHNGCVENAGLGAFDEGQGFLPDFFSGFSALGEFFNSTAGFLTKDETVVHYNMLVDLDIQSLEEPSIVLVTCSIQSDVDIMGSNSRVLGDFHVNNTPITVEIPICISRYSDPRGAKGWNCDMRIGSMEEIAESQGGIQQFVGSGGTGYQSPEAAAGTSPVFFLSGGMLFAADAPAIGFIAGQ